MYPLLFLSILALGFIVEKAYSFHKTRLDSKLFFSGYEKVLSGNDPGKLKEYFTKSDSLTAKVMDSCFQVGISGQELEARIERSSSVEVNALGRGLNALATIGSVAPLVGFLGTVDGMITAFGNIAAADEVSAQLVAGGIYTALITTAYGLIIAIPCVSAYNYFVHRIDGFAADMEKTFNLMLNRNIIK